MYSLVLLLVLDKVEAHYTQLILHFNTLPHPGDHSVVYEDFPYAGQPAIYASSSSTVQTGIQSFDIKNGTNRMYRQILKSYFNWIVENM